MLTWQWSHDGLVPGTTKNLQCDATHPAVTASERSVLCFCLGVPLNPISGYEFYVHLKLLISLNHLKKPFHTIAIKPFFTFIIFSETLGLPSYRGLLTCKPAMIFSLCSMVTAHCSSLISFTCSVLRTKKACWPIVWSSCSKATVKSFPFSVSKQLHSVFNKTLWNVNGQSDT